MIDAAQKAGANITAVVLKKYSHEEQFEGATLICVDTEQERFHELSTHKNPIASFALPGGPGTLREVAQAMENAAYENGAPVILVKVGKYFEGIIDSYVRAAEAGLMKQDKLEKLKSWSPEQPLSDVLPSKSAAKPTCKTPTPCKKS